MANEIHRPPHSTYKVDEMIKTGLFDEAKQACIENEEFYESKAAHWRDMLVYVACKAVGSGTSAIRPSHD